MFNELHEVHTGVVRIRSLARSYVWWPNLDNDIEQVVKECSGCQQHAHLSAKDPIHRWELPKINLTEIIWTKLDRYRAI